MYASLWRFLPGPTWVKALQALILFALVTVALFLWVFPVIAPYMPFYSGEANVG